MMEILVIWNGFHPFQITDVIPLKRVRYTRQIIDKELHRAGQIIYKSGDVNYLSKIEQKWSKNMVDT